MLSKVRRGNPRETVGESDHAMADVSFIVETVVCCRKSGMLL
jgi:hypothetical protein